MTTSRPCSDTPLAARLIVLEGMPGAGKTTAAQALARNGLPVLGEYTDDRETTITISAHPRIDDDDAHQHNWLRKSAQCAAHLARSDSTVIADRDWLSSLSYAWSASAPGDYATLQQRAGWAWTCLLAGQLLLPGTYVIFDLDPATSLTRRRDRLRHGHPWNGHGPLGRLRDFYASPADAILPIHPGLAHALRQPAHIRISGHDDLGQVIRRLQSFCGSP
jgi:AAA domain-containing protein